MRDWPSVPMNVGMYFFDDLRDVRRFEKGALLDVSRERANLLQQSYRRLGVPGL